MLRQIEWWLQNGPIKKNEVLPVTNLFFWKIFFSLKASYNELIWCINYTNVHIRTFCKRWSFIWRCFFPVNILNFYFQENTNTESISGNQRWHSVVLSTLFHCCFINIGTTSINIRRLNFHFQPKINIETLNAGSSTLKQGNYTNVVKTLFCWHWDNVAKCTSAQLSFSTKYQSWNNLDGCRWSTSFQRYFDVDVFAGSCDRKVCYGRLFKNVKRIVLLVKADKMYNWIPWKVC